MYYLSIHSFESGCISLPIKVYSSVPGVILPANGAILGLEQFLYQKRKCYEKAIDCPFRSHVMYDHQRERPERYV
jgi:hypothetical protein